MVVPLFGWSAGDIVASIQILYHVGNALRESGGAREKYQETAAWVDAFAQTLDGVRALQLAQTSGSPHLDRLAAHIRLIDPIYEKFEKGLQKNFEAALSSQSSVSTLKSVMKKIHWTVRDLHGHVTNFKIAIDEHMAMIVVNLNLLNREELREKYDLISMKISNLPDSAAFAPLFNQLQTFEDSLKQIDPRLVDLQASIDSQSHQHIQIEDAITTQIENLRISSTQNQDRVSADVMRTIRSTNHGLNQRFDVLIAQLDSFLSLQATQVLDTQAFMQDLSRRLDECIVANKSLVQILPEPKKDTKNLEDGPSTQQIHIMPLDKNPDFVGREEILDKIDASLKVRRKVAIVGLGGIGKSEIAAAYCYRQIEGEESVSIFWVHGDTASAFIASYQRIADRANMRTERSSDLVTMDLVAEKLKRNDYGKWLMVIDNADDYNVFEEMPQVLTQAVVDPTQPLPKPLGSYIPNSPNGRILFTSRSRSTAIQLAGSVIPVPSLSAAESQALMRVKLWGDIPNADTIQALGEQLEHLPLAITQACASINRGRPAIKYLKYFQKGEKDLIMLLRDSLKDIRRREARPDEQLPNDSVIYTWITSLGQIDSIGGSRAVEIVCFMSHFHRRIVPVALIEQAFGTDYNSTERHLSTLCDFEFITRRADPDSVDMHRFTQLTAWAWMEQKDQLEQSQRIALATINKTMEASYFKDDREMCRLLAPHAEEIRKRRFMPKDQVQLGLLNLALGLHLVERGQQSQAAERLGIAAQILKREEHVEDHVATVAVAAYVNTLVELGHHQTAEQNARAIIKQIEQELEKSEYKSRKLKLLYAQCKALLGKVLWSKGKWDDAERLYSEAYHIRNANLPPDNTDVLATRLMLAVVHRYQGKQAQSVEVMQEVLRQYIQLCGKDHEYVFSCYNHLGLSLLDLQRYDEAEEALREALSGRAVLLQDHPSTMQSKHSLTVCLWNSGKINTLQALKEVEDQFRSAVDLLKDNHPTTILIDLSRAVLLRAAGENGRALLQSEKVVKQHTELLGQDHPDTLLAILEVATTHRSMGEHVKAKQLAEQVFQKAQLVLGPDHQRTVIVEGLLAKEIARDNPSEGEERASAMLRRCSKKFGPKDLRTLVASLSLASIYDDTDRPELAIPHLETVIHQEKNGPAPISAVSTQAILARTVAKTGDFATADEQYSELVESCKSYRGSNDPELYSYVHDRAFYLYEASHYDKAEPMMRDLIDRRRAILGDHHRHVYDSMSNLALVLRAQEKYEVAELMGREILEGRRQHLSENDPSVYQSLNNLALVLCDRNSFDNAVKLIRESFDGYYKVLGASHKDTLMAMHNMAYVYKCAKDWKLASTAGSAALEARERVLGPRHHLTLETIRLQLEIFSEMKSFEKVAGMRDSVLERHESKHGPEHRFTLEVLRLTGAARYNLGSLAEAEADLRRAFDGFSKLREDLIRRLKVRFPWKMAFFTLRNIYQRQERFQDAIQLVRDTMDIEREACGPESSEMGFLHCVLGSALQNQKKFTEAVDEFEIYLNITEKSDFRSSGRYKYTINIFAKALYDERNIRPQSLALLLKWRTLILDIGDEAALDVLLTIARCLGHLLNSHAEETFDQVINLAERLHGADSAMPWQIRTELAETYFILGRYRQEAELYEPTVAALAQKLGQTHITTVKATSGYAMAKLYSGDLPDAEHKMRWVLAQRREIEGPASMGQSVAQNHLGVILRIKDDLDGSVECLRAVLGYRVAPENDAPVEDVLRAKYWLAWTLMERGELEEAEELAEAAYEGRKAIPRLGAGHRETLDARSLRARARFCRAKTVGAEEAETEFREIVKRQRVVQGENHPLTLTTAQHLAWTMALQGRCEEAQAEARSVVEGFRAAGNTRHPFAPGSLEVLARINAVLGCVEEAEEAYREAVQGAREIFGAFRGHVRLQSAVGGLVLLLVRRWVRAQRRGG